MAAPVFAADLQDIPQLEALAKSEAALQLPALTGKQRFVVGPIDPHLQLERCSQPVKPMVGPGGHMRDRILVELRCPAPPHWHIYVPVRVVGTSLVAIAAHAIVAGSVLSEKDMRVEQRIIKVGRTVGSSTVILAGVQAGDTVVTDGQLRLVPDMLVRITTGPTGD